MLIRAPAVLFALAFSLACGQGKSDDEAPVGDPVPRGISSGPISGFGSIFVAGTEWETDFAESIRIDGLEVSENDLRLGMWTTVEGAKSEDGSQGRASRIEVNNSAQGPIAASPSPQVLLGSEARPEEVSFTVLGAAFIAGRTTAFSVGGNLWSLLEVGAWVEVSGVPGVGDLIRATRVDFHLPPRSDQPQRVEVEGRVSSRLDDSFLLGPGRLRVLVSTHSDCMGPSVFPDGEILDGMVVEVHGELLPGERVCADKVEHVAAFEDAEDFQIVGIVTALDEDPDRFTLGELSVQTDRSTDFEPRRMVLGEGRMLEVKGSIENGVLSALAVEQEASVVVEAVLESLVNGGPDFQLLGIVIEVLTEGGSVITDGPYGVGSFVEVKALRKATGGLTAVEVRVEEDSVHRVRLEGRVDAVNGFENGSGSFRVEGVLVNVDPLTQCEQANGKVIDCDDFFEMLEVGDLVKANAGRYLLNFEENVDRVAFRG